MSDCFSSASELEQLRQELEILKQAKLDLEILLDIHTTHADAVEEQLHELNRQLQQNQARLQKQQQALSDLAQCQSIYSGDLATALQTITQTVTQTLNIERCSVCLYNRNRTVLRCRELYELTPQRHSTGYERLVMADSRYAQALESESAIAVDDANTDPRTQEFSACYLTPLGITSLLDVPIRLKGEVVGVLCTEQVGRLRHWRVEEENFVSTVAYLVSLAMEAGDRKRREQELQLLLTLTQSINAAPDFHSAIEVTLRQVCLATGWHYGEAWITSADRSVLEYSPIWYCLPSADPITYQAFEHFHQQSVALTLAPGVGLAGQIWQNCQPQWIPDVSEFRESFVRANLAQACGFKAGFGVPIIGTREGGMGEHLTPDAPPPVLAVLIFFILDSQLQDERLVELIAAVAMQLGTVIQQKLVSAELKALISAMPDFIMVCDRQGRCLKIAPNSPHLPLEAATEQIHHSLDQSLPAPTADLYHQSIQQALDQQTTVTLEYSLTHAGQKMWFAGSVTPLSEQTVLWVARDITQNKQAEVALRQAEEKYRSIFENAVEGIFQSTPAGYYLSVNQSLARIYGYESISELMTTLTDINQQLYVQPQRREEFITYMEAFNEVSDFESEVYRKDRSKIWISENVRSVRDPEGNILYYEGTVQDITARRQAEEELRYQRLQTERLLLNILPQPIAERLKDNPQTIADNFAEVTVLFADIVDFTKLSDEMSPTQLVNLLNGVFSAFDALADHYRLEKIKTIGDAYMAVGGLPQPRSDHADAIAEMALEMQQEITQFKRPDGKPLRLRIGINTGPVVAGVIGKKKFIYDLWGDTVNVASRMEAQGIIGGIQTTINTYKRLKNKYIFQQRGPIHIKGKGEMTTYCLMGKKIDLRIK